MADDPTRSTYVRETEKSSGTGIYFIVGGLVVAVAVILWLVFGGTSRTATTPVSGSTTNVTIDAPAASPAPAADPVAPAPAPAETAPAAPAPAEPVAPAPVTPSN